MIKKFLRSVGYALKGLLSGIKEERNLRIDIVFMIAVYRLSLFYDLDKGEKVVVILLIFLIPALELLNTAIERAVDNPDDNHYMSAGDAKDTAAAGVFFMSAGAVVSAFILFWDIPVISDIFKYYLSSPLRIAGLLLFAVLAILFVMRDEILLKIRKK